MEIKLQQETDLQSDIEQLEKSIRETEEKILVFDRNFREQESRIKQKWESIYIANCDKTDNLIDYKLMCEEYIQDVHSLYETKVEEVRRKRILSKQKEFEDLCDKVKSEQQACSTAFDEANLAAKEARELPDAKASKIFFRTLGGWVGKQSETHLAIIAALGYLAGFGLLGYLGYCIFDAVKADAFGPFDDGLPKQSITTEVLNRFFSAPWIFTAIGTLFIIAILPPLLNIKRERDDARRAAGYVAAAKQKEYERIKSSVNSYKEEVKQFINNYSIFFPSNYEPQMFDGTLAKSKSYFKMPPISSVKLSDYDKSSLLLEAINTVPKYFDQNLWNAYNFQYRKD
jgi:hypothetical protein